MRRAFINSIRYRLGETERHYRDVPTFAEMTTRHSMPDLPDLFGWGSYFTTQASIDDLAVDVAACTLASSAVARDDIDVVFMCSANFRQAGSAVYQRVLSRLGLTRAFPIGVTLNDCTMLLSTLEMARALVTGGDDNNPLISPHPIGGGP